MTKKILIIEDEKDLRFFLTTAFKTEGFEIIEAIDGETGIEKAKKEKPDLILLDLLLPGIDGFEVLSRLKKDEELEKIPIFVLSNFDQEEKKEKSFKLGAVDYLVKANFSLEEIVEKVSSFLKNAQ